jgi:hypothetical protein
VTVLAFLLVANSATIARPELYTDQGWLRLLLARLTGPAVGLSVQPTGG